MILQLFTTADEVSLL